MHIEKANAREAASANIIRGGEINEQGHAQGKYYARCFDKDGGLLWEDDIQNVVTDLGANQLLDSALGSGPIAGPFLGLISSVGYTGIPVVADTMLSHSSANHVWNEAGNGVNYPNWSTPASNARAAVSFAAASGRQKAMTAVAVFTFATNGGTLKGCFLVFGTGAVATNNNTGGVLYSAGVFSNGDKIVGVGDRLEVTYATSI
jgi:hypothetical protein